MDYLHDIERGKMFPEIVNVLIEIPMGSRNKFEIDRKNNLLRLDRVIYSPFHYPTDYGFIPQTWGEDEDPLDAMVMTYQPVVPLCILEARPIGLFRMKDEEGVDDKILCVPCGDPRFFDIMNIKEIPKHWPNEIAHFFKRYKELEEGKYSEVVGWFDSSDAIECIKIAADRYDNKFIKKR